ncbi:MAG: glycosyltransferase [Terracidiphilus sp.]
MTLLGKASEFLRDAEIVLQRYSPLSAMAFSSAERIYVTTHDSLRLIRSKWHGKTEVQIAVANHSPVVERREHSISMTPRFVFAGRLLRWKGVHLAIPALAEARKVLPSATLTVYGNGPDERWLRGIAERLGIADAVEFNGELPRQKLTSALSGFTALVFPSLHDAGGMIVLEALSKGLPVVCLDLGGPGTLVNASCGMLISTKDADETRIVSDIAKAMIALGTMPAPELALLSMGAMARAEELSWTALTKRVVASRGRDISKDGGFTTAA